MLKPNSSCKGCKDRTAYCHADCERYKDYKRRLAEWYAAYYERRAVDHIADNRPWLHKGGGKRND